MKKPMIFLTTFVLTALMIPTHAFALNTGHYTIMPKSQTAFRLAVNENEVVIKPANNQSNQKFMITNLGNGIYRIKTGATIFQKFLYSEKGVIKQGAKEDKWKIIENSDKTYSFMNMQTGKYLVNKNKIITEGSEADKFLINPISAQVYYTVAFDNGNGQIKYVRVKKGEKATPPFTPVKAGYTFKGWDKDLSKITSNLKVSPVFEKNVITYDVCFMDGAVLKKEKVEQGKAATAPSNPVKTGYTFAGWDKPFNNVTSNLTVNAKWTPVKYTITYNLNGGTHSNPTTYTIEDTFTLKDAVKTGFSFLGWTTTGVTTPTKSLKISKQTGNKTYTANWKTNTYTVTFKDGNNILKTQTVEHGKAATAPTVTKPGYIFAGWDKSFNNITGNLTVNATWKEATIAFGPSVISIVVGEELTLPAYATPNNTITYKSSDNTVATVDNKGKVKGLKSGKVTISATANEKTVSREITVKAATMTFDEKAKTIFAGGSISCRATTTPAITITYTSSDTSIATVSKDGLVTGKKAGTVTITAAGGGVVKRCIVNVKNRAVIKNRVTSMYMAEPVNLNIENATKVVSSNDSVATCDLKGKLTLKKPGSVTITASNADGSDKITITIISSEQIYVNVGFHQNGKCLYVDGFSKNTTSAKDINNNDLNKKFKLVKTGNAWFIHSALGDGTKVLADTGKLQTQIFSGNAVQKWTIAIKKAGTYVQNVSTKRYLTANGMSSTATPLTLPIFSISSLIDLTPAKPADGWYTFTDTTTKKNMDVPNAKKDIGLQLIEYTVNNCNAQKFYIKNVGGYNYKIFTSNKNVLSVKGATPGGGIIQAADIDSDIQKWRFFLTKSGASYGYQIMNVSTGQCLGVKDSKMLDKIHPSQYYTLTPIPDPSYGNPPTGWVEISPKNNTGVRLDVANNDAHHDTNIGLWTRNGNNAQRYFIQSIGNGKYKIATGSTFKKRFLASDINGNVKQSDANQGTYQQWYIYKTSDGLYEFKNVATGKCLDIPGGDAKAGANVQTYKDNDTAAQRFYITSSFAPTGSAYYPITYKRKWNFTNRNSLDDIEKAVFDEAAKNLNTDKTALEVGKGKVTEYQAMRIMAALNTQYYYQARVYEDGTGKVTGGTPITDCYSYNKTNKSIIINVKKCRTTYQQTKTIETFLQNLSKQIFKKGMTERQAVKALNDYIVKNIKYKTPTHNMYTLVTKKVGECDTISRFFELMMDVAGVDSKHAGGKANSGHAWNYVNVEDAWYHIDTTWNDSGKYYLTKNLWKDHILEYTRYNY